MSDDISTIRKQLWAKMRDKKYRDSFVAAQVSTGIAAQLITMRERRGWSQKYVAEQTGMAPARISVMENPSYDRFTLTTLRRLASAFDVALIVKFAPFSELAEWASTLSPESLDAKSFESDRLAFRTPKHHGSENERLTRRAGSHATANQQYHPSGGGEQLPMVFDDAGKATRVTAAIQYGDKALGQRSLPNAA